MCSYSWRVPLNVFGPLTIIAAQDIGDLGPLEGEPLAVSWGIHRHIVAALPCLLVSVLLLVRGVGEREVWFMLIPVGLYAILFLVLQKCLEGSMSPAELTLAFNFEFSMLAGLTCLWILSPLLERASGIRGGLRAAILLAGSSCIATVCLARFDRPVALVSLPCSALSSLVVILTLGLSGWTCRRRFALWRVAALQLVICLLMGALAVLPFDLIMNGLAIRGLGVTLGLSRYGPIEGILRVKAAAALAAALAALFYAILIPFTLAAFAHPSYRARWRTIVGG